jgi:indolepyruvate ferredoxin oxidoreductase
MLLAGYSWQLGMMPLTLVAIEQAIELNGAAVAANRRAFALGRLAAYEPEALLADETRVPKQADLPAFISARTQDLMDYQNAVYAQRFRALVDFAGKRETALGIQDGALQEAVARSFYKLMAYKDEYEVARLYSDGQFQQRLAENFEPGYRLNFHLAPPLLARHDPATGRPRKIRFGAWMRPAFALLARLRWVRGTGLDIFGYTAERREERAAISEYEARMNRVLAALDSDNRALACRIAQLPMQIRGFGPVKRNNAQAAARQLDQLMEQWENQRTAVLVPTDAPERAEIRQEEHSI